MNGGRMLTQVRGLMPLETEGVITFVSRRCAILTTAVRIGSSSISNPSAGRPNPTTFPFESITLHLKPPLGGGGKGQVNTDASVLTSGRRARRRGPERCYAVRAQRGSRQHPWMAHQPPGDGAQACAGGLVGVHGQWQPGSYEQGGWKAATY